MILFTKYSHEVHSGKYIKPLCYSSLILKQTVCLDIRGLYRISKAEQKPGEGGGGVLGSIIAGYVPLATQNPYSIIVFSVGQL